MNRREVNPIFSGYEWWIAACVVLAIACSLGCVSGVPPDSIPECQPVPIEAAPLPFQKTLGPLIQDTPTTIDVMLMGTPTSIKGAGGMAKFNTLCGQIVADCNACLATSQCGPRLRLVHVDTWNHKESGDGGTDLYSLISDTTVSKLRDTWGADMVQSVEENIGNMAGTSFQMAQISSGFALNAFGVVRRIYAISNHSSIHEFGHNMGLAHDKGNAAFHGCFSYSYGAKSTNYRCDMSYSPPSTRVNVFSNGGRFKYKAPTGTLITLGDPVNSDAARTINQTSATVANFRIHKI